MSFSDTRASTIIKSEIEIKSEPEDISQYQVKTELNYAALRQTGTFNIIYSINFISICKEHSTDISCFHNE